MNLASTQFKSNGNSYDYDYLIIGSGLYGITFARLATDAGKRCLVIDRRHHFGGNCYTDSMEGINVHIYGAHIFHTSNKAVWDFVNRFADFNNYVNSPKAKSHGKLYSLPFNMNTFYELWQTQTPEEAMMMIESQRMQGTPSNLEEQALSLVGKDIYYTLIKEYTEKQWGRNAKDLPAFIIKRLPLRFTFNNNYFNDTYQGIPIGGYTAMMAKMLEGIEVRLDTDFFSSRDFLTSCAAKIVYTGCIDEFFDYSEGQLEYRSLDFDHNIIDCENYQGNAVVNYCDSTYPYTRILEHKHFEFTKSDTTVITYEYPKAFSKGSIPYYPINDDVNHAIYCRYQSKSKQLESVIFGGRLSEYKYMDMHVVIESAMNRFRGELLRG